jgi:hypothetical protein
VHNRYRMSTTDQRFPFLNEAPSTLRVFTLAAAAAAARQTLSCRCRCSQRPRRDARTSYSIGDGKCTTFWPYASTLDALGAELRPSPAPLATPDEPGKAARALACTHAVGISYRKAGYRGFAGARTSPRSPRSSSPISSCGATGARMPLSSAREPASSRPAFELPRSAPSGAYGARRAHSSQSGVSAVRVSVRVMVRVRVPKLKKGIERPSCGTLVSVRRGAGRGGTRTDGDGAQDDEGDDGLQGLLQEFNLLALHAGVLKTNQSKRRDEYGADAHLRRGDVRACANARCGRSGLTGPTRGRQRVYHAICKTEHIPKWPENSAWRQEAISGIHL